MDGWLAGKRRTRRASTVRGYEMHNRLYISPVIGDLPLERVSAAHVEQVLAAVPGSAATRHRVLATLRAALSAAVKARQITWNPCASVELEPESPPEARRWTPAEAARFIRATADDPMGLLFRIAILNSERRGELCGLRWSAVNLADGVLTIDRTLLQLGGKLTEGTPKTRAGVRRVYLDHGTAELLRARLQLQELERMLAGEAWAENDLVFCQPDGRPWNPDYVSKRFRRLAAQAGVPPIKLHEARHSANSLMRDAGVDQELRMRIVGHASADINDRYTHTLAEAHRAAAEQTAAYVLREDPS
jgi:integrase